MNELVVRNLIVTKRQAKSKKENTILKGISANFHIGKINAVMGPNGSGKSTLLNAIYGISDSLTKTSGSILLDGKERSHKNWFMNVSYVEQENYITVNQTVRQCLDFAISLVNATNNTKTILDYYSNIIEKLILQGILDKKVKVLSGGEKQRLHVAMDLIMDRQILILDEPTSDLDSHLASELIGFLKQLAVKSNKMVIITIHQPSLSIFNQFDNLLFLRQGIQLYNGPAASAEKYFESINIVKPQEWIFIEFLFEIFYETSSVIRDPEVKKTVTEFLNEIQQSIDILLESAPPAIASKKIYTLTPINYSHVATLLKRFVFLNMYSPAFYATIISSFIAIVLYGGIRIFGGVIEIFNMFKFTNLVDNLDTLYQISDKCFSYFRREFMVVPVAFVYNFLDNIAQDINSQLKKEISKRYYSVNSFLVAVIIFMFSLSLIINLPAIFVFKAICSSNLKYSAEDYIYFILSLLVITIVNLNIDYLIVEIFGHSKIFGFLKGALHSICTFSFSIRVFIDMIQPYYPNVRKSIYILLGLLLNLFPQNYIRFFNMNKLINGNGTDMAVKTESGKAIADFVINSYKTAIPEESFLSVFNDFKYYTKAVFPSIISNIKNLHVGYFLPFTFSFLLVLTTLYVSFVRHYTPSSSVVN